MLLAAAYLVASKLGVVLGHGHAGISAIAPASGIALVAVLLGGYRLLPAVALGSLLASATASLPLAAATGIAVGNAGAAFAGAALLRRVGFRGSLERMRDVVSLLLVAGLVAAALSATIGIASLAISGIQSGSELSSSWRVWWLGDVSGELLVASGLLVFASAPRLRISSRRVLGLAFGLGALATVSVLVFRYHQTFGYAVFPVLLVLALLYRQRGAAIGSLLVSSIAVWFTARGHGPFVGGTAEVELARAQLFAITGALTALLVTAAKSERDTAEAAVRDRTRSLFENAPYALVVVDHGGRITLVNSQAERLFGYRREALLGGPVDVMLPMREGGAPWYRDPLGANPVRDCDVRGRRSTGAEFPVEISLSPIESEDGPLVSVAVTDVTDRKLAADALAHRASHDPLTGLPNRTLLIDRLEHALGRARRSRAKLAVIFLDLDDFKLVNDTRGHDMGDLLLLALAPRLTAALRPGDTISRFGGDEFVVLCEELSGEDDALAIAERMADACSRPVQIGDYEHVVTVSAGVATLEDGEAATASDLLRDADAAMYRAKASGKGRIEVFDDGMRARLIERIAVESQLRLAIERHELRLVYQPVVSLRNDAIVGVEALLRWEHPERGLLAPAEFIGVAEISGLIVPIGEWVIQEACRQAAAWRRAAPDQDPVYVSVNLSPRQVTRSDVAACVARSLRGSGLDPKLLELEITERALLDDGDACARALRELKALGVRLVLDDFGTGYSSLSHLKRLTIDALKIDRSFVRGLGHDTEDSAIVSAMLSMAGALEVVVTAEGVETPAQLMRLRAQGCEYGQGFLLSRPASAAEMSELLSERQAVEAIAV